MALTATQTTSASLATATPSIRIHEFILRRSAAAATSLMADDDEDDEEDADRYEIQPGENWLKLLQKEGHSVLDDSQDMSQKTEVYPSILSLASVGIVDAPSKDCFICLDLDGDTLAIKDMRLPSESITSSGRKKIIQDWLDDESSNQLGIYRKEKYGWESLARRQLRILSPGDCICTSLLPGNLPEGLVLEYSYAEKSEGFDITSEDKDETTEENTGMLTQPLEEDDEEHSGLKSADENCTQTEPSPENLHNTATNLLLTTGDEEGDDNDEDNDDNENDNEATVATEDSDKTLELAETVVPSQPTVVIEPKERTKNGGLHTQPEEEETSGDETTLDGNDVESHGELKPMQKANLDRLPVDEKVEHKTGDVGQHESKKGKETNGYEINQMTPVEDRVQPTGGTNGPSNKTGQAEASNGEQKKSNAMGKKGSDQTTTVAKGNKRPENDMTLLQHPESNGKAKERPIQQVNPTRNVPSYARKGFEIIAGADDTQPESMITLSPAIAEAAFSRLAAMRAAEAENEDTVDDDSQSSAVSTSLLRETGEEFVQKLDKNDDEVPKVQVPLSSPNKSLKGQKNGEKDISSSNGTEKLTKEQPEPKRRRTPPTAKEMDQTATEHDKKPDTSARNDRPVDSDEGSETQIPQVVCKVEKKKEEPPTIIETTRPRRSSLRRKPSSDDNKNDNGETSASTDTKPRRGGRKSSPPPVPAPVTVPGPGPNQPETSSKKEKSVESDNLSARKRTPRRKRGMSSAQQEQDQVKSDEVSSDAKLSTPATKRPRRGSNKSASEPSMSQESRRSVSTSSKSRSASKRKREGSSRTEPSSFSEEEIRVMTTGIELTAAQRQMVKRIGGILLEKLEDTFHATHVIAGCKGNSLRRTPKLMIGLCRTGNIVDLNWLLQSAKEKRPLPADKFLLVNDKESESMYDYNMSQSLSRAKEMRSNGLSLLGEYSVFVCSGVAGNKSKQNRTPPLEEFRLIVEAAGATFIRTLPNNPTNENCTGVLVIVSKSETESRRQLGTKKVAAVLRKGAISITTEELFHGIMKQQLEH